MNKLESIISMISLATFSSMTGASAGGLIHKLVSGEFTNFWDYATPVVSLAASVASAYWAYYLYTYKTK
jgi:hypothetical protein